MSLSLQVAGPAPWTVCPLYRAAASHALTIVNQATKLVGSIATAFEWSPLTLRAWSSACRRWRELRSDVSEFGPDANFFVCYGEVPYGNINDDQDSAFVLVGNSPLKRGGVILIDGAGTRFRGVQLRFWCGRRRTAGFQTLISARADFAGLSVDCQHGPW
jgi:hypothetical protein